MPPIWEATIKSVQRLRSTARRARVAPNIWNFECSRVWTRACGVRQRLQTSYLSSLLQHAITPPNWLWERTMSLSQIPPEAQASQVIKGESQVPKAEHDPLYINLKVKSQVCWVLASFYLKKHVPPCNCPQDGSVVHFRIKLTTGMKKVNVELLLIHRNYISLTEYRSSRIPIAFVSLWTLAAWNSCMMAPSYTLNQLRRVYTWKMMTRSTLCWPR